MIDRIIEAFARPHYQVTAIDDAIIFATVVVGVLAFGFIFLISWTIVETILERIRPK